MLHMQAEKLQMLKDAKSEQEHAFARAIEEDRVKQQKECVSLSQVPAPVECSACTELLTLYPKTQPEPIKQAKSIMFQIACKQGAYSR